jgi:hypothetical protein
MSDATRPHEIMIRAIHLRALQRSTMSVPGISRRKYPRKENPRAKADDRIGETEVALHVKLGDADVRAIDVGDQVKQEKVRHEPLRDAPSSALADRVRIVR